MCCVVLVLLLVRDENKHPQLFYISSPLQLSGKIQNLKWRVGVAMSSNKCKNLTSPYVLLTFDVKEVDGTFTHHSTELTYDQFKVMSKLLYLPYFLLSWDYCFV